SVSLVNEGIAADGSIKAEVFSLLKELTKVDALSLFDTPIGDGGLAQVNELRGLEKIWLIRCKSITDTGLASLKNLKDIHELYLNSCTGVSGTAFADLKGLTKIKSLELRDVPLTDTGLKNVGALRSLEYLTVDRDNDSPDLPFTDAGLSGLG